jgi:alpha-galactosidase
MRQFTPTMWNISGLEVDMNDKSDTAKVGQDFATAMGPGGVIGTKFTWPAGPENMQLTGEREKHWEKWVKLYNEKMLSKGNYLNLYDIVTTSPNRMSFKKKRIFIMPFMRMSGKVKLNCEDLKLKSTKYMTT